MFGKTLAGAGDAIAYSWFNPKLRDNTYRTGDIYDDDKAKEARKQWKIETTNVTQLDYLDSGEVKPTPYKTSVELKEALQRKASVQGESPVQNGTPVQGETAVPAGTPVPDETPVQSGAPGQGRAEQGDGRKVHLKLFVVEDLSRDVIELLGARFDIEPAFFREHIFDYAWCNTRDPWVDPPNLNVVARSQNWLQLRFVRARYFKTTELFEKGRKEAEKFNIQRRPDDDENNKAYWDEEGAIVGITRTRASFWTKHIEGEETEAVGVLLLDPTIKEGKPLWCGYRNWEPTPSMATRKEPRVPSQEHQVSPRDSFFDNFVYWAQKPASFRSTPSSSLASNTHIPVQALLHLCCAEWLTMADYIKTRLGQIDWEIAYPKHFIRRDNDIDVALKKLHTWRRLVPLYREMLTETLQRVFNFPCHTTEMVSNGSGSSGRSNYGMAGTSSSGTSDRTCVHHNPASAQEGPISAYRADFARALSYMEEYQQRIDRLSSLVAAVISIEDSRRGLDENRNLQRLTWLATFFIPLSFVASLFSMQSDIRLLLPTMRLYFIVAIPLATIALVLAFVLALPTVQKKFRRGPKNDLEAANKKKK
ncbi:hypothetical protein H2199_006152 [Coniosporium tulheliwenetii]|uniref:Uncharacterized protein n=1 Tax=Coniosporium tulheliwenetii TaxID=3383036 RepID=A0ACC2YX24_9PEZI|nr:hypothetical protein H2199_006152 [Cladosporium sp. JES 115]